MPHSTKIQIMIQIWVHTSTVLIIFFKSLHVLIMWDNIFLFFILKRFKNVWCITIMRITSIIWKKFKSIFVYVEYDTNRFQFLLNHIEDGGSVSYYLGHKVPQVPQGRMWTGRCFMWVWWQFFQIIYQYFKDK